MTSSWRYTATILACLAVAWQLVALNHARGDVPLPTSVAIEPTSESHEDVERLIAQLGGDRYVDRQRAQQELIRRGIEAFDQIQAASSHADPEIASAAKYILGQIDIPWTTADDPPEIRQFMRRFDEHSDAQRLQRIQALAIRSGPDVVSALCRIVRFDAAEYVSRTAATAILRPRNPRTTFDASVVSRELGDSGRRGAAWIRLYAAQMQEPAATLPAWTEHLESEFQQYRDEGGNSTGDDGWQNGNPQLAGGFGDPGLLDDGSPGDSGTTTAEVVADLAWHLLSLQKQLGRTDGALATVARLVEHDPAQFDAVALEMIDWLAEIEAWDKLDEFLARHRRQLAAARQPLYAAAIARRKQGQNETAEQLARQALDVPVDDPRQRLIDVNYFLLPRQQWEWAEREYRRTIELEPMASQWSLYSRIRLADMLYDLEDYAAAAAELEIIETKLDEDIEGFRKAYNRADIGLLSPKQLSGQREFYLACDSRQQQKWDQQRAHLRSAVALQPENPDILIAMYRIPVADEEWRKDVFTRIAALRRELDQRIRSTPEGPEARSMLADAYNQWAWLVSNTEGDFQKAIRYSRKSLELVPNTAGCLDTLGRCYYAAGDYENAVKYQRQAVELDPSLQVMQRQLDLFERTLEKGDSGDGGDDGDK